MHDPQTLAFSIKRPWHDRLTKEQKEDNRRRERDGRFVFRYRPSWIDIWHVDPEKDGSDDSCGWGYTKLTVEQRRRIKGMAASESQRPYFHRSATKEWEGSRQEAEVLYRGLVLYVCRGLRIKMSFAEAAKIASEAIHRPDCVDSARAFCFLPGYHTNSKQDTEWGRQDCIARTMSGIARMVLSDRRPWYKHPRWHLHHWRITVPPLRDFKRWAWGKCATCGGGFKWGESPITNTWFGTGPLWFKSERDIHHDRCRCVSGRSGAEGGSSRSENGTHEARDGEAGTPKQTP